MLPYLFTVRFEKGKYFCYFKLKKFYHFSNQSFPDKNHCTDSIEILIFANLSKVIVFKLNSESGKLSFKETKCVFHYSPESSFIS